MIGVTIRYMTQVILLGLLLSVIGCSKNTAGPDETGASAEPEVVEPTPTPNAERPTMTRAECEAKEGRVVGDIGDGAIHRPDYTCESGQPPIATIRPGEGEPIASEGAVCCP